MVVKFVSRFWVVAIHFNCYVRIEECVATPRRLDCTGIVRQGQAAGQRNGANDHRNPTLLAVRSRMQKVALAELLVLTCISFFFSSNAPKPQEPLVARIIAALVCTDKVCRKILLIV